MHADARRAPENLQELHEALQVAIRLEHATLPPYIYAWISLDQELNGAVWKVLRSVIHEEMLHFALACNILNALGGSPLIDAPDFIPDYPSPLPGTIDEGVIVSLRRASVEQINVFMEIEKPAHLYDHGLDPSGAEHVTIGMFYRQIQECMLKLGEGIFIGDPARQLTSGSPVPGLIAVRDLKSALNAIELIVEQGEGTNTSPYGLEFVLAHYYQFAQIFHGKHLIPRPDFTQEVPSDLRPVFGGAPLSLDASGVIPLTENPRQAKYPAGSAAAKGCRTCNFIYTKMLKSLHSAFNGQPEEIETAIGQMFAFISSAKELAMVQLEDGSSAGPSFEYELTPP